MYTLIRSETCLIILYWISFSYCIPKLEEKLAELTTSLFCECTVNFGTVVKVSDHLKPRTGGSEKPNPSYKTH